jgi:hypothetical protein
VGCADDDVEVALRMAVPLIDVEDDPCPPTRYVTEADVLDAVVEPELALAAAMELNGPPIVALVAVEVDKTLLVES